MTTITVDLNKQRTSRKSWAGGQGSGHRPVRQLCLAFILEMFGIPLFEFFDTTGSIYEFLLAGEERMTGRADLHLHLRHHGAKLDLIATGAYCLNLMVFRVYIILHTFLFLRYTCMWCAI